MSEKLNNIEAIIKAFKKEKTSVMKYRKIDGITMECATQVSESADTGIKDITDLCKKYKLHPISAEKNKEKSNVFALQFPEMLPEYTDKELEKMYNNSFKWLLDGVMSSDTKHKVTTEVIMQYKAIFVKQAVTIHFNSNTNLYKEKIENYLNNKEYTAVVEKLFIRFANEYVKGL